MHKMLISAEIGFAVVFALQTTWVGGGMRGLFLVGGVGDLGQIRRLWGRFMAILLENGCENR